MKVSLNTIKQYLNFELPSVDELVKRINEQIGQVEEVIDLRPKYNDVVIVKVVSCEKHPNADKLSVCLIDDGGVMQDVERQDNGLVQVVCGAPNVHAGMFAAWLPPRSTVPATYTDAEPFILGTRELRGITSNGMLAAADELDLGADHNGIIDINPDEWKPGNDPIVPGASFAKAYGLDDVIIDIENKMFTHRPDCFGQIGVAREIAGILGKPFTSPEWYRETSTNQVSKTENLEFSVFNNVPEKAPRFMAVAVKNVTVKPSPLWLQVEQVRLGSKSINNIVDVTNYVMLLTAQPTHAYDYDKLNGATLGVRMATKGEKATLLNDKTYTLSEDDIVIVDGAGVVGLAGVMGGSSSEVSDITTTIVLECADFDMYTVRKTSMRYGLFTDALTRFSKGQSALQQSHVLQLLLTCVLDVASGQQASDFIDISKEPSQQTPIRVTAAFVNDRLGLDLSLDAMADLLRNVEIQADIEENRQALAILPPFWRTDLELSEDIVEEVGRLYGFDKLPRILPKRSIAPVEKSPYFTIRQLIRESLSKSGANEVLGYSFVSSKTIERADQDKTTAFQLSNALSPELEYYRLSLLPSLLEKVHPNSKAGYDEFALFEIGKSHDKTYPLDSEGLPTEQPEVSLVYTSKKPHDGAAFYKARRLTEQLAIDLGCIVRFVPLDETVAGPFVDPFERARTALVVAYHRHDGAEFGVIGVVGELQPSVRKAFKLPDYTAACSLHIDALERLYAQSKNVYHALSKYPRVTQDISLKVATAISYNTVFQAVYNALFENMTDIDIRISPLAIYQPDAEKNYKTISLRIEVTSHIKTLTDKDVSELLDKAAAYAGDACQAQRI